MKVAVICQPPIEPNLRNNNANNCLILQESSLKLSLAYKTELFKKLFVKVPRLQSVKAPRKPIDKA